MGKYGVAVAALIAALAQEPAWAQESTSAPCFVERDGSIGDAFPSLESLGPLVDDDVPTPMSFFGPGDALNLIYAPPASKVALTESGITAANSKETDDGGIEVQLETSLSSSRASLLYSKTMSRGGDLRVFNAELSAPASDNGDSEITRIGDINTDLELKVSYVWYGSTQTPKADAEALQLFQKEILGACQNKKDAACTGLTTADADRVVLLSHCVEKYLGPGGASAFRNKLINRAPAPFFGVSGQVGRKSFKFLDTTTGLDAKDRQSPWSLEVFGGVMSADKQHIFRASYEHADDYKEKDKRTICQPPGTGGLQECRTAPFGAPEEKRKELGTLEYRWLPEKPSTVLLGAKVSVTYDFESDEYEVDVPLYLFKSDKGDLNGGVRGGIATDEDFYVAVFVGQKLE